MFYAGKRETFAPGCLTLFGQEGRGGGETRYIALTSSNAAASPLRIAIPYYLVKVHQPGAGADGRDTALKRRDPPVRPGLKAPGYSTTPRERGFWRGGWLGVDGYVGCAARYVEVKTLSLTLSQRARG